MNIIGYLTSVAALYLTCYYTEEVKMKGCLKTSDSHLVEGTHKIIIRQGREIILIDKTSRGGKFDLTFYPGDETGKPIDFFTIASKNDTVLLASVTGFHNEVQNHGNLFYPKKVETNDRACPKCKKKDRVYSLVYVPKEQRDYDKSSAAYFCGYDLSKF
jgi:hypothetical protein